MRAGVYGPARRGVVVITRQDMDVQMGNKVAQDIEVHFDGLKDLFKGPGGSLHILKKEGILLIRQMIGFLDVPVTE